jgi:hypothetical protein
MLQPIVLSNIQRLVNPIFSMVMRAVTWQELQHCSWNDIPQGVIDHLIESIPQGVIIMFQIPICDEHLLDWP